ncbi:hypothetical protein [Halomonas sp. WWR20]
MSDFSEEFRLPTGCPNCGNHRMRVSEARDPEDKVFCASCNTFVCLYKEAKERMDDDPKSEAEELMERVMNKKT